MSFFVTAICHSHSRIPLPHDSKRHCFGHFGSLASALKAVESNSGSMQESLYDYLVVEEIDYGIHSLVKDEKWYWWNGTGWQACPKPNGLRHIINFAIG